MIRNSRVISVLILALLILFGTVWFTNRLKKYENNEALKAIPIDAGVILRAEGCFNLFEVLNEHVHYKEELLSSSIVQSFYSFCGDVDSLFQGENEIMDYLGKHPFYISLHAQGKDNVKALFLSELTNKKQEQAFRKFIYSLKDRQFQISQRNYNTVPVFSLTNRYKKNYTISIYEGIVFGSVSHLLVESAIRQLQSGQSLLNDVEFIQVKKTAANTSDCNLYINFSNVHKVLRPLTSAKFQKQCRAISDQSAWGELDLDIDSDALVLNGFFTGESNGVYKHLLVNATPQRASIYKVLPYGTRAYLSMAFKSGNDLKQRLYRYYETNGLLTSYEGHFTGVNKSLDVKFQDLFFDQLQNEIALAYMDFDHLQPANNGLLVLEVKSQSAAREKLLNALRLVNGEDAEEPVRLYCLDEEVKYPIYNGFKDNLMAHLFTSFLPHVPDRYFAFVNNYLVFANSIMQLEQYIYANILHKTLDNKKVFEQHRSNYSGRENVFVFCETGQIASFLKSAFEPLMANLAEEQKAALGKFYGVGLQLSGTGPMIYATAHIDYKPNRASEPRTIWQSLLDSTALIKPVLVDNHYTNEKEVLIQDAKNNLYLINNKGRILWQKVLDGPILGEISQIDYYRNNKLQYLFNTKKRIYLLDRNGNHVAKYPIQLSEEATNGLTVFDYDKSRNYRIFIATADKRVILFDKTGNQIAGWNFKLTEGKVTVPIQHFRSNNKDYIVFSDNRKAYILNRRGEQRIKIQKNYIPNVRSPFFIEGQDTSNDQIVTTNKKGELVKIALKNGATQFFQLEDVEGEHALRAIPTGKRLKYVITTPHSVSLFDFNHQLIYSKSFDNEIELTADIYQFSSNNHKVGIVEKHGGRIYLINDDGNFYKSFPLVGFSRFSIGFLKSSSSQFNLIVGGSNNYLYNYRVE